MKRLLAVLTLAALAGTLSAHGRTETPTLVGVIAFKGNEPFAYLALTDDQGRDWKLTGTVADELRQHQNQRVEVGVRQLPDITNGVAASVEALWFKVLS